MALFPRTESEELYLDDPCASQQGGPTSLDDTSQNGSALALDDARAIFKCSGGLVVSRVA